jgi:hypothetical protein
VAAATRFELVSSRLQDERSGIRLSYAAKDVVGGSGRESNSAKWTTGDLNPAEILLARQTATPSSPVAQVMSSNEDGCGGGDRTRDLSFMRRMLSMPSELLRIA